MEKGKWVWEGAKERRGSFFVRDPGEKGKRLRDFAVAMNGGKKIDSLDESAQATVYFLPDFRDSDSYYWMRGLQNEKEAWMTRERLAYALEGTVEECRPWCFGLKTRFGWKRMERPLLLEPGWDNVDFGRGAPPFIPTGLEWEQQNALKAFSGDGEPVFWVRVRGLCLSELRVFAERVGWIFGSPVLLVADGKSGCVLIGRFKGRKKKKK